MTNLHHSLFLNCFFTIGSLLSKNLVHVHAVHELTHHRTASPQCGHHHDNKRQQHQKPRKRRISLLAQKAQRIRPQKNKDKLQSHRENGSVVK